MKRKLEKRADGAGADPTAKRGGAVPEGARPRPQPNPNPKSDDLSAFVEQPLGTALTTNQGLRIENDQDTLKAGERGPSLLEDFHFREKITHFDHERIPERIVHARGSGAHGYFEVYEDMSRYTRAGFLTQPGLRTPVFVRFSTVAGSRGSTDMARDVRGFAVKFYTQEGNFDLVGNNMPVFFIQDAIKFPDLIHAVKPEPDHEMPQAASAHDTFWDFISLMPESTHMIMWLMSDRAIPRSFRMMEGFGVHTFRLVNAEGQSRFVKFHWKPILGVHSVAWDEAQKISGKDPDFLRRDLWEAIESGNYPQWEFGVQMVDEEDEHRFDFDLLDPTKIIPEELVPVQRIGRLTLDRNPDNFFAETEQVAFHPGHVVPGIDFSNDPLLQGRLFSYTDTQLIRLGGPNFAEIPINRPVAPVHNNQRDGYMRQTINRSKTSYEPNSIGAGCPMQAGALAGGYVSFPERMGSFKIRARSEKFFDHFSQARLFVQSQSAPEKDHMVEALRFELGKLERVGIRSRMVATLALVDRDLAARVAEGLGLPAKVLGEQDPLGNRSVPADGDPAQYQSKPVAKNVGKSKALSMADTVKDTAVTRRVAILAADGVDEASLSAMRKALFAAGAQPKVVAPRLGYLKASEGGDVFVEFSLLTASSVLFDAVYVPGGADSVEALSAERDAVEFVTEAFRHCKTIAATGEGVDLLSRCPGLEGLAGDGGKGTAPEGVLTDRGGRSGDFSGAFVAAIARHRHWTRAGKNTTGAPPKKRDETRGREART
ncbi:MAG: catalase [Acidobacteriota bacterium]